MPLMEKGVGVSLDALPRKTDKTIVNVTWVMLQQNKVFA